MIPTVATAPAAAYRADADGDGTVRYASPLDGGSPPDRRHRDGRRHLLVAAPRQDLRALGCDVLARLALGADRGRAFVESLTLGSVQFCTNPGLIVTVDGPVLDAFIDAAAQARCAQAATAMLTPGIAERYRAGVDASSGEATLIVRGSADGDAAVSSAPRCSAPTR